MKKKKTWYDTLLNILLTIGILLCAISITFKVAFVKVVVKGNSMNPTIENGSKGYMVKVSEKTKLERFDVVASEYNADNYYIIKRVLGLPGEEVSLIDNVLTVNGEEVEQTFTFNKKINNFLTTSWSLGDDEYLLVGDNRGNTIEPTVEKKDAIIAKNGFSYAAYNIFAESCGNSSDYSSCPIGSRKFYWFKNGQQ